MGSVWSHSPYSPDLASSDYHVLAIWKKPALTSFRQLRDGAERLAPVAAEEGEQLLLGGSTESR